MIAYLNSCRQGPYILANLSGRGANRDTDIDLDKEFDLDEFDLGPGFDLDPEFNQIDFSDKGFIIKTLFLWAFLVSTLQQCTRNDLWFLFASLFVFLVHFCQIGKIKDTSIKNCHGGDADH